MSKERSKYLTKMKEPNGKKFIINDVEHIFLSTEYGERGVLSTLI